MITGSWNYPTSIRFGPGRIRELPDACAELGVRRPLLITDPGLAALEITERTLQVVRDAGLPVGLDRNVKPNPNRDNVAAGVEAFRAGDHDGVIAFGGGSALDVGKAVALMAGQRRPIWDFEDVGDNWTRVDEARMAPVVAVPTTSGTGSEVGRASVLVDEATHTKRIIFHARMLPGRVICDPELTVGLPAGITAAVGMDALSHNLEAWCAPGFHPQADGIAAEGIRLVHRALRRAVLDGADLEARSWMMAASLMGATAFQKGLGGMHAMSHPIGAIYDAHHGLTNAVVMPYVLVRNRDAISERCGRLAAYLGIGDTFTALLDWVLGLREDLGIPHTTPSLGVVDDEVARLAPMAHADPSAGGNPIPLTVDDYAALFRASLAGRL